MTSPFTYEEILFLTRACAALRDNCVKAEDDLMQRFEFDVIDESVLTGGFIAKTLSAYRETQGMAEEIILKLADLSDELHP